MPAGRLRKEPRLYMPRQDLDDETLRTAQSTLLHTEGSIEHGGQKRRVDVHNRTDVSHAIRHHRERDETDHVRRRKVESDQRWARWIADGAKSKRARQKRAELCAIAIACVVGLWLAKVLLLG